MLRRIATTSLFIFVAAGPTLAQSHPTAKKYLAAVEGQVNDRLPALVAFYKTLHRNPELSLNEVRTAGRLAAELRKLGFTVTEKVGGTGIVGVLKNGDGPTILVRTDLDALPVTERTGLPYASKAQSRNRSGQPCGVMHACGHDTHMSIWVGVAQTLKALSERWAGTLVFIGQPAEEIGMGARMMLDDGLFKRFPRPNFALALHADSLSPVGRIRYSEGLAMANVDTVEIIVRGRGGHGSAPHTAVDPIVLAAKIVLDLQTIVSREVKPIEPAVVTVGSIHGGTKSNIIPDDVTMQLTVRSTTDRVRKQVLDAIKRIAEGQAATARAPVPTVKIASGEFTPALYNDAKLTRRTMSLFREVFGAENIVRREPVMGGEDFARYGRAGVPILMYQLGSIDKPRFDAAEKAGRQLPSMHSDSYYPDPAGTLRMGVKSMSLAVLNLLKPKGSGQ